MERKVLKMNSILHSYPNLWCFLNIKFNTLYYIAVLGHYWNHIYTGRQFLFWSISGMWEILWVWSGIKLKIYY